MEVDQKARYPRLYVLVTPFPFWSRVEIVVGSELQEWDRYPVEEKKLK